MGLHSLLKQLASTRVLVIGDLMIDHYIWGDVHRISPEAPVPVVFVNSDSYALGGAANVAANLANLGVLTSVLGHYGLDEAGIRLHRILSDNKIDLKRAGEFSDTPTIIKTRVIVRNQQLCRIDREDESNMYRIDDLPGFDILLEEALSEVDAVIISDYAKGVVTQPLVDRVLNFSRQHPELLVAVDPKPSRALTFRGAGLLTPNRSEALELAKIPEPHPKEAYPLKEVCRRIHEFYCPELLIITLGADGMALCNGGEVLEQLPTQAREVFDVSGAGDTVVATLTAALTAGAGPAQAAQLANAAAGCVISHMGTAPITFSELEASLLDANEITVL